MIGRRHNGPEDAGQPPLSGVRALEVGNYMAAPFCGMQLADLGAEVIKVEHPEGGDQVRLSAQLVIGFRGQPIVEATAGDNDDRGDENRHQRERPGE